MDLGQKICSVIFSNAEQEFSRHLKQRNVKGALSVVKEIISTSEIRKFRDKTNDMSIKDFLAEVSDFYIRNPEEISDYDKTKKKWEYKSKATGKCKFPGCEEEENLQKDHIIPSFLNKNGQFGFIPEKRNMMPLCPFHNRVKTNSILIGIAFLVEE